MSHNDPIQLADMTATEKSDTQAQSAKLPPELVNHPRYRVLSLLGAGGMGMVYRAEHVLMGRTVALKVMAQRFTSNPTAVERFRREVRAAAKLAHPNIVTAYDADEAEGRHFLVMEYVEGVSLERLVNRRGPLPVAAACHIVRIAALGLQHAHGKGMVHRDIKPQNVMVNRKGVVKILDFGLARLATETELPADDLTGSTGSENGGITGTNIVMGTPDYLSPEQARSTRDVDHRSDLYSLGCLFYFALSGRPPFAEAHSAFDKVIAHTTEQPKPISDFRTDIPDEIKSILLRMMAKDPGERFASASDVANALQPFSKNQTASHAQANSFIAIPLIESIPVDEFEIPEVTPHFDQETSVVPSRKQQKNAPRHHSGRRKWIRIGAIALGIVFLSVILRTSQNDTTNTTALNPPNETRPFATPNLFVRQPHVLFVLPKLGMAFEDLDLIRQRLIERGAKVSYCSRSRGQVEFTGDQQSTPVNVDWAFSEIPVSDIDAIVFPGPQISDWIQLGESRRQLERIVRTMNESHKVIAGIGTGQSTLIRYDLLNGKTAAQPDEWNLRSRNENFGNVTWDRWRRVVTDDNLVTASGARDGRLFADAILAAIID